MKIENLWNRFEESGRVTDYLAYVQARTEGEDDADENSRYDPETAQYR